MCNREVEDGLIGSEHDGDLEVHGYGVQLGCRTWGGVLVLDSTLCDDIICLISVFLD